MELKDLKDPISIIHFIKILTDEASKLFDSSEDQFLFLTNEIDPEEYSNRTTGKRTELESNLKLLDVALISLKIEEEEKYFKLKEEILNLNLEFQFLYILPETPPNILYKHVRDLQIYKYANKSVINQSNEIKENSQRIDREEVELSEFELIRIKDKIAMLIELGIIEHLINKYPYLRANGLNALRLTKLLSPFLGIEVNSLKKIINAFVTNAKNSTDYPKITDKVKNEIDKLTIEK